MPNNRFMPKLSPDQANLLSILVALNAWEQKNRPPLLTQSGRSLYFQLAQVLLAPNEGDGVWMNRNRFAIRSVERADIACRNEPTPQ